MNRQKNAGFTLLETMIVVAIVGILTAIAAPSYQDMIETNSLKKALESFQSDMQFARTEAIKQSTGIIVSRITGDAGAWCYGLARDIPTTRTSCDCTETDTADADYCDIKIVSGTGFNTTNMVSASGNSTFDFRRGTIGANGVTFSTDGYAARVVFSGVGRIRICSPSTETNPMPTGKVGLPGKEDCSE
ncbi:MAG: GspH/FimT family pseudopilin [Methylobacter sp.]|uniref:GspH/FimT family pseudopilin n=1 Tax=Methylobacter sp. TaxID=2051955 RepID=UPI002731B6E7|nr:GspH/FimT family pseudopilin [Methylobacter sp.]MDP1666096.1 GspH/FimT family pseudopilin [Methylobacter sp.]